MLSISRNIGNLLNKSQISAFNFPPQKIFNIKVDSTQYDSEYDYQSNFPLFLYESNSEFMTKYWQDHKLLPKGLGQELIDQIPRNNIIYNTTVEGSGQMFFRIKDELLLQELQKLANLSDKNNVLNILESKKNVGVFYPLGEINKKLELNSIRSLNKMESLARIQEISGQNVTRYQIIDNYSPYHGLILAFLHDQFYLAPKRNTQEKIEGVENTQLHEVYQKKQQKKEVSSQDMQKVLSMENIALFIAEKDFQTSEEILKFGQEYLNSLDMEVFGLLNQLTNSSKFELMQIFVNFLQNEQSINILNTKEEAKQQFLEKVQNDQQFMKSNGIVLDKQNQQIKTLNGGHLIMDIKDGLNQATEFGKIYAVLCNLKENQNIEEFHFSSNFQDDNMFQDLQKAFQAVDENQKDLIDQKNVKFWGCNDIFYENDENLPEREQIKLNYYDQFFDQLGNITQFKMKEKYPDLLPGDIEQKYDTFLAQSLGWTKFLDHKKNPKTPYLIKCEDICDFIIKNENLINLRVQVNEILQTYKTNMQDMKFVNKDTKRNHNIQQNLQKMATQFKFEVDLERLLARILISFPDQILQTLETQNFQNLAQYALVLSQTVQTMIQQQIFTQYSAELSQQQIINQITLMRATINTVTNCFYILGVINDQKYI